MSQGQLFMIAEDEPVAPTVVMRDYQEAQVRETLAAFASARSALVVSATGTGKTEVFLELSRRMGCPTLILAERKGLVHQTAKRARLALDEDVEVEQGDYSADGTARVIVASKDSLHPDRLARLARAWTPGLIVVDEAHHGTAATYRPIYDRWPNAKIYGTTATPDRSDEVALGEVFDEVAHVYEIDDAVRDGWLVRVRVKRRLVEDIKLDALSKQGGDFSQSQLDDLIAQEAALHQIAKDTIDLGEGRRGIVFVPGIASARLLAEVFNHYDAGSAASLDQSTPDDERTDVIARHQRGELRYVCNVNLMTEGYDDPTLDLVVNAAPTLSRSRYAQRIGRGTRPLRGLVDGLSGPAARIAAIAASEKSSLLVLDFVGSSSKHRLVGPEDVLGGKSSDEVVAKAKEISNKEGGDVSENIDKAKLLLAQEEDARRRAELRRKASITVKVKGKVVEFDPFDYYRIENREENWGGAERYGWKPPTDQMLQALRNRGIEPGEGTTFKEARTLLEGLRDRPTVKMVQLLDRNGLDCRDWKFEYTGKVIDWIAQRGWGRPISAEQRRAIVERARHREPGSDG